MRISHLLIISFYKIYSSFCAYLVSPLSCPQAKNFPHSLPYWSNNCQIKNELLFKNQLLNILKGSCKPTFDLHAFLHWHTKSGHSGYGSPIHSVKACTYRQLLLGTSLILPKTSHQEETDNILRTMNQAPSTHISIATHLVTQGWI